MIVKDSHNNTTIYNHQFWCFTHYNNFYIVKEDVEDKEEKPVTWKETKSKQCYSSIYDNYVKKNDKKVGIISKMQDTNYSQWICFISKLWKQPSRLTSWKNWYIYWILQRNLNELN